ncbi:MAG: aminotransferase class I/II-fold pyridoxal phosphate-dependent enzyme [Lachnospiraceae bacterium]|nr:aminotransferase class I/II-fold pyridoxal phosphate-dependent enzyme [Lachnospiraceae bacterium]
MEYHFDFTSVMDRRGQDASAIDAVGTPGCPGAPKEGFDLIPMWVADLNFPYPQSITDAMTGRLQYPHLSYFGTPKGYIEAISWWQSTRNGVCDVTEENLGYDNGVLGCVAAAVRAVAEPGEGVLINTPAYIGFTSVIDNIGYKNIESPMTVRNGKWYMDLDDMEKKIRKHHIRAAVFCNPQNPVGRAWTKEEIREMMDLFEKYGVLCISDEVWSDIMLFGTKHVPAHTVSDYARTHTVSIYGTAKTFNLAGLYGAYDIIYDPYLRDRIRAIKDRTVYNKGNLLAYYALMGGYSEMGAAWVDEMNRVLSENAKMIFECTRDEFPGVWAAMPDATYMMFFDCREWCEKTGETMDEVLKKCHDVGVAVQDGRPFRGEWAFRMNHALPTSRVAEALRRMKQYVFVN